MFITEDFQNATIHAPVKYRPDYDKVENVLNENTVGRKIGGPAGRNLDHFSTVEKSILETRDNGGLCLDLAQCDN